MKKIYFFTRPLGPVYYMNKEDDWDGDSLDIGYNNPYEMRGVCIGKDNFSESFDKIKEKLEKNKLQLVTEKYEELLKLIDIKFEEEDSKYHDGFDAPY